MSKEQKKFLNQVRIAWATEFPFLKLVDLDEVPKMPKGCNFRCDDYAATRGVYYFITFHFSQRRVGEFSISVTLSASPEKSVLSPPLVEGPTPTKTGLYNIAEFLNPSSSVWFARRVTFDAEMARKP